MRIVSVCVLAVALLGVSTPVQARESLFSRLFPKLSQRFEARRVETASNGSTGGSVQSNGSTGGYSAPVPSYGSNGGSSGGSSYSVPQPVAIEVLPLSSEVYEDNCPNCVK